MEDVFHCWSGVVMKGKGKVCNWITDERGVDKSFKYMGAHKQKNRKSHIKIFRWRVTILGEYGPKNDSYYNHNK